MEETIIMVSKRIIPINSHIVHKIAQRSGILIIPLLLAFHQPRCQEKDSTDLYKKIKAAASKRKFTRLLYDAVFVEPKAQAYPLPASGGEKMVNPYITHEGKIIRRISITSYDPFGYSVADTVPRAVKPMERFGNKLHISTRHWVIGNKLLFEEGDTVNALSLSESERLLRQSGYLNDARVSVKDIEGSDSVDVIVVVQDKWPVEIPFGATESSAEARLKDQNLFGLGQQFEQYVSFKAPNRMDYSGFYNIANIDNTYISSRLGYVSNPNGTDVYLAFDRPFYSPLSRWAGGAYGVHGQHFYLYRDTVDGESKKLNLFNYGYDLWLGRTFKLNDKRTFFNQSNNIILAGRYYGNYYLKRPEVSFDVQHAFANSKAYVGTIGYAVQQYYKDQYIYRFGNNEDVPEGLIAQFLYGVEKKEFHDMKYYTGTDIAYAKHFGFGYLSGTLSYSLFFAPWMDNDIVTNYRAYYFSDLFRGGRWYFRQFVNGNLVHDLNKQNSQRLILSADELFGFEGETLRGSNKLVFQSETVAYAPYKIIGFKFAPVLSMGFGLIGDHEKKLLTSNIYQGYSLGLMIRNENLLNSTFLVSVGMYPFFPNGNSYVIKYNPVTSFTLRVRAFSISKPAFLSY